MGPALNLKSVASKMVLFTIFRGVQQVQQLLDRAVRGGRSGQHDPLVVETYKAGAADNSSAVRLVNLSSKKILSICKRQKDRPAVMTGNVQKITASGFPAVTAAAGDIHSVAVVALHCLKKTGDSFVADA